MTDIEKAKELVDRFYNQLSYGILSGKDEPKDRRRLFLSQQCAIICVDEIMQCLPSFADHVEFKSQSAHYWNKVKQAIESL
jgi:hypothetical protein